MKTLIIAEKPDMGRNIAAAIEPKATNKRTHLVGERYIITWAIGHLVGLAEPDKYDEKYKKWRLQDLPIIPDAFKLIPHYKTRDQLKVIAGLAKSCDSLVNACDAGREGQLIFAYIVRHLRLKQPVQRLWISDLTPETIRQGFALLKNSSEYENLTKAAQARSEADWLVGMNGTRAFTTRHQSLFSVGRVQTPVLALIHDKQVEIEAFTSQTFYEVRGFFQQGHTDYKGIWQGERISERSIAEDIAARTSGQTGRIASYEKKDTREFPYKLYDLTLLQREANAKCGFSAKKTLDLAQSLYEKHKVISYPRTNSNYVTEANIAEMHRSLKALQNSPYDTWVKGANPALVHAGNRGICNAAKVEDHHAILPTHKRPGTLTADEQKLYDLIVRRFLSHFYPAAEYTIHTVLTEVTGELFKTTIKQFMQQGWKVIYADSSNRSREQNEDEADQQETAHPFHLDANRDVQAGQCEVIEKKTEPPKPFTEGTLLKAMESAGKHMEDEELREAMKDSGLGTPATRAATIERLKKVDYIAMKGKRITITAKGRMAIQLIRAAGVELLTSPEMTGQWERRLSEIAKGKSNEHTFMARVKQFTADIVHKVRNQPQAAKPAFETSKPESVPSGRKTTGTTTEKAKTVAMCPREGCGGHIIPGRKGYGCSHYKQGCTFVIWKTSFNKSLTVTTVRILIDKGRTNPLTFKHEDGTSYKARIVLTDANTGQLSLEPL